jgi:mRNA-degrading endonuclease YafQ of YafQ-DinJ toxin-antitoxin module
VIKVIWDQGLKRSYKRKEKNNDEHKKKFWNTLEIFAKDPFDPQLKTHKLSGKLKGLWVFSCLLVFRRKEEKGDSLH